MKQQTINQNIVLCSDGNAHAERDGIAITIDRYRMAQAGENGIAIGPQRGFAKSGRHGISLAGEEGAAAAGPLGVVSVLYACPSGRWRLAVGYVGEGGILPDTDYTADALGNLIPLR